MPARIIAVANQKGGVGKTVTSLNVAATLASRGRRTLLVDLDPQGHCGVGLGVDIEGLELSSYDLLCRQEAAVGDIAIAPVEGLELLHLVPSNLNLALAESASALDPRRALSNLALATKLRAVRDAYDEIVLDCPPALGKLSLNAFLASDMILIPVGVGFFSIQGLRMLAETLRDIFEETGLDYEIRCLITRYRANQTVSRDVKAAAHQMFGEYCFSTAIRENVAVEKSIGAQLPLIKYAPDSQAGKDYRRLVDELLSQQPDAEDAAGHNGGAAAASRQGAASRDAQAPVASVLAPPEGALLSDDDHLHAGEER